MEPLNFPQFHFRVKNTENQLRIFDIVRKKFVILQPEEWVRQHIVHYLHKVKNYPLSHINVERQLLLNGIKKRYDVVVFHVTGKVKILVECKSPKIKIDQGTFDQIAQYNLQAESDYLMVSNGLEHFYCQMDLTNEKYRFLKDIPHFSR